MYRYTRDLTDILSDIFDGMSYPLIVDSINIVDGLQVLSFCDVYHAQVGYDITLGINTTKILAVDYVNETITVGALPVINVGDSGYLYKPFFFYGTPIAISTEIGSDNMVAKTPMYWLRLNYTEKGFDIMKTIRRTATIEMYCLTQANHDLEQTSDLMTEVCITRRMAENFTKALREDTVNFSTTDLDYQLEIFTKFGVYAKDKGSTKQLIGKDLTGVCWSGSIDMYANVDNCACIDIIIEKQGIGYDIIETNLIVY